MIDNNQHRLCTVLLQTHNNNKKKKKTIVPMKKVLIIAAVLIGVLAYLAPPTVYARDASLFRTVPIDTPNRGVFRMSNVTYYSKIPTNHRLQELYSVQNSSIYSSLTELEYGVVDNFSINATFPYYVDHFEQITKTANKSGAGDIIAGLKYSYAPRTSLVMDGLSLGTKFIIPVEMHYAGEPLGYRVFSSGEFGYGFESGLGFTLRLNERPFFHGTISGAYHAFPQAPKADTLYDSNIFYDSGFGYRGIGRPDADAFSPSLFEDQISVGFTGVVPLRPWFSSIVEVNSTTLLDHPETGQLFSVAPGIMFGRTNQISLSVGMAFRVSGPIPRRTLMVGITIPSLSPRDIRE
jgi:hypothetical protein